MKRWRDDNALWRENPSRWPLPAERDAHNGRCYVHGAKAMPELAQAVRSGAMSINAGAAIAAGRYAHARGWILPLATNPLYGASIVGKPRPGRLRGGTEPFSRHIWRRNAPRAGSPAQAVTGHAPKRRTSVQLTGPSLKRYTKSVKLDFGSI